ncbi:PREDICTED: uncharacterized protein LOC107343929 isoform X2 [Acropora digitifera]|uniref:uncharacterized protein LOC107343929 isoform X2 n=1 Tax=Acropora digitifera TaxID=70779 RepID=UPI00077AFAD2|nr:PREDICTED: uncharacterized protein LOC107343929 isoform X2 [Acropora digitifera]
MKSSRCVIFAMLILQTLSFSAVEAAVNSSLSVGDVKGPPSAPRNVSRSVIGITGLGRHYRVLWKASKDNGGLPVNYTVKLCQSNCSDCRSSVSPECHVANVISPSKGFLCVLSVKDFTHIKPVKQYSNHCLCVEASNVAGRNQTCILADVVGAYKGTPRPPLSFSVGLENGQFTVRWEERKGWQQHALIKKLYTVTYYPLSKQNFVQTKVVEDSTVATLTDLEIFTVYCVQLFIQFEHEDGKKTAPSDRLGPLCHKTEAGEPSNQPQIVTHKDYLFPDDSSVRDVAVEWKPALPSSWNGTPGKFVIFCYYSVVGEQKSFPKKGEYYANATANSTVLRGLNSGDNYTVFMDKCNEEGKCSGRGKSYRINAVGGDDREPPGGGEFTKALIAGISLLVILCVVSAVAGVYCIRKGRRERIPLDIFHKGEDEVSF